MATNHTEHCQLSQWEPGDQVLRTDFNADHKKIDAVLEKLERTVDEHTRYLNLCGNCQIHMMSYVGNGNSGVENSCSMTCPKPPVLVFIQGNDNSAVLVIRPNEVCNVVGRTDISGPSFRWNGNTVMLQPFSWSPWRFGGKWEQGRSVRGVPLPRCLPR